MEKFQPQWSHSQRPQAAGGLQKPQEPELQIVGEDGQLQPQDASLALPTKRHAIPNTARLQDHDQIPPLQRSISNVSIMPNHGDETTSLNMRTMSEGEAVAHDLRKVDIDDPQSPASPISGTMSPTRPLAQKRPSHSDLPEGTDRPTKLHTRTRHDNENPKGTSSQGESIRSYDHITDPHGRRSLHRYTTSKSSRPSHLRNSYPATARIHSTSGDSLFEEELDPLPRMEKQLITRPITQEQLISEVKSIYAGLVMVERKCAEIDQQQSKSTAKLSNEQYQALIALHRTLLHEHHDFYLASQHPSASSALKKLATKYAMPARMWRHGIHSFLELLRHRLPDSYEHMLAFIYLAYSMMALLMESVESFEETWIECLGDVARYRMAIEESDLRDREIWAGVARMWYNRAADKSPTVGRVQHHLAVLARPNVVQQLFYYTKALVTITPFINARESIMLLFNQFLEPSETNTQRFPVVESTFVKAHGILFVKGSISEFDSLVDTFLEILDNHVGRVTAKFRVQGSEIASSLWAAVLDFGNNNAYLYQRLTEYHVKASIAGDMDASVTTSTHSTQEEKYRLETVREYWLQREHRQQRHPSIPARPTEPARDATFAGSEDATYRALILLGRTMDIVFSRIGDKNTLSFTHVMLACIWSLAFVPGCLEYAQAFIPWEKVSLFLNTLGRHGANHGEKPEVQRPDSGCGRQLPEDFVMRGLLLTVPYYPEGFFSQTLVPEDERNLELPSHAVYRAERCLWLGQQLSALGHWLSYDEESKQFAVTEFGKDISSKLQEDLDSGSSTEPEQEITPTSPPPSYRTFAPVSS